jgi:ligand-binding SRPBCC domain-containing protein
LFNDIGANKVKKQIYVTRHKKQGRSDASDAFFGPVLARFSCEYNLIRHFTLLFPYNISLSSLVPCTLCLVPLPMPDSFKIVQQIPAPIDKTWDFFADPANLQTITPPDMGFTIISKNHGDKIYTGQIIEYKVRPLFNIPLYWMTEITQVKEREFFIDEQKKGPYRLWQHQHHFKEIPGGTEMTDIVHYQNPFWFIGDLANALFVKRKLKKIFEFRYKKVEELFGAWR